MYVHTIHIVGDRLERNYRKCTYDVGLAFGKHNNLHRRLH